MTHVSSWQLRPATRRFLTLTTEHPDFPDTALKENVAATLQTLRDKIPLWHSTMPKEEAEAILKAAFPE